MKNRSAEHFAAPFIRIKKASPPSDPIRAGFLGEQDRETGRTSGLGGKGCPGKRGTNDGMARKKERSLKILRAFPWGKRIQSAVKLF